MAKTAGQGQKPTPEPRSNPTEGGGGMARVVSLVTGGKRLARAAKSSRTNRPTRSFHYNDNGSMVDLQCEDHASTFHCRGAGTEGRNLAPTEPLIPAPVPQASRFQWRERQNDVGDCWSVVSGVWGVVRPPVAEQLLAPLDGDRNSFRMWTPTPLDQPGSRTHYETTTLNR